MGCVQVLQWCDGVCVSMGCWGRVQVLQRCAAMWTGVPMMWWGVYVCFYGMLGGGGGCTSVAIACWDVDQCCNGMLGCVCVFLWGVGWWWCTSVSGVLGCGPALQQCVGYICVFLRGVGGCTSVVMVCWDVDQRCNGMLGCVYMCVSVGCWRVYKSCNGVPGCEPVLQWCVMEWMHWAVDKY